MASANPASARRAAACTRSGTNPSLRRRQAPWRPRQKRQAPPMGPAQRCASLIHTCSIPVFRGYREGPTVLLDGPVRSGRWRGRCPPSPQVGKSQDAQRERSAGAGVGRGASRLRAACRMRPSHSPRVVRGTSHCTGSRRSLATKDIISPAPPGIASPTPGWPRQAGCFNWLMPQDGGGAAPGTTGHRVARSSRSHATARRPGRPQLGSPPAMLRAPEPPRSPTRTPPGWGRGAPSRRGLKSPASSTAPMASPRCRTASGCPRKQGGCEGVGEPKMV